MKKFARKKPLGRGGFTLVELLAVIGIIAVVCAIAIPNAVSINKALNFKQVNDYAESIFMAAQANLTQMRSDGSLKSLQAKTGTMPVSCEFPIVPEGEKEQEYVAAAYGSEAYEAILPPGSVDDYVRTQQVVVEYNPITGNVYSVFFCSKGNKDLPDLAGSYESNHLRRTEGFRKPLYLGYYEGSALNSQTLDLGKSEASIAFKNDQEGMVTITIPNALEPDQLTTFVKGLRIDFTVTGEQSESGILNRAPAAKQESAVPGQIQKAENSFVIHWDLSQHYNENVVKVEMTTADSVKLTFALDSLYKNKSFASLSAAKADSQIGRAHV